MDHEAFEAHARLEEHHWWFVARRAILLAVLQRVAPRGSAVADVGCGTGANAAALAAAGYDVLGVDPTPHAIALARRRFPGVRFIESGALEGVADHVARGGAIVLADVLEHVDDDAALLRDAVRPLPPGAHVVITVPADLSLWSGHDVAFGHRRRYEQHTLAALWQALPVEARLLSPFNARLRLPIALWRRFLPGTGGGAGDLAAPAGLVNPVLRRILASERGPLLDAIDTGRPAFRRGVSLLAILRRT